MVSDRGMLLDVAKGVRRIDVATTEIHTNLAFFRHVVTSGGRLEDLCGCEVLDACQLSWAVSRDMVGRC